MMDLFREVLMATFRSSIAMIKRKGGSGSPCLTPLVMGNSSEGDPLIRIKVMEDERQL